MAYNGVIEEKTVEKKSNLIKADFEATRVTRPIGKGKGFKFGEVIISVDNCVILPAAIASDAFSSGITFSGEDFDNTDAGALYLKSTPTTAPAFRIDVYKDEAMTAASKVATATVTDDEQAATFTEVNGSGLTGAAAHAAVQTEAVQVLTPIMVTAPCKISSTGMSKVIGIFLNTVEEKEVAGDVEEMALILVSGVVSAEAVIVQELAGNAPEFIQGMAQIGITVD